MTNEQFAIFLRCFRDSLSEASHLIADNLGKDLQEPFRPGGCTWAELIFRKENDLSSMISDLDPVKVELSKQRVMNRFTRGKDGSCN